MSSDRAVFIAYSSALVISVIELRRRQGARNAAFLPVDGISSLPVSDAFGVHGCICILSSRGRTFRRIWGWDRVRRAFEGNYTSDDFKFLRQWSGPSPTFRTLSVIMWVFGVLKDTLRTITQFITTMVVTDITNIRYLQSKVHESQLWMTGLNFWTKSCTWTYFPIRGTAFEVSGTFFAIRKRKTVWPRRVAIDMVHFWPPAAKRKQKFSQSCDIVGSGLNTRCLTTKDHTFGR